MPRVSMYIIANTAMTAYTAVLGNDSSGLIGSSKSAVDSLTAMAASGGALDQLRGAAESAATALASVASIVTGTVGSSLVDSSYLNLGLRENTTAEGAEANGGFTYRISDRSGWTAYINGLFGDEGSLELSDEQKTAFTSKYGYDGTFDEFLSELTDDDYIWANTYAILTRLVANRSVGSFDTGGYTGEWGSDGRAAILHEKELVLNKADTANILAAVDIVR
jgi:hypothetical protein